MDKVSIIIPAYNEQDRISRTITHYSSFFDTLVYSNTLNYELLIILNGCTDKTIDVVRSHQKVNDKIHLHNLEQAGKGRALIHGFKDAIDRSNDLIGFVDADMATSPESFYTLINKIANNDGIIASRYIEGATISPARPFIKRWGSQWIYEPLVWLLLGLQFKDLQCGAKLFRRRTVESVIDQCSVLNWAFDIEFLYLCKKNKFFIQEVPTIWTDQIGSKLRVIGDGLGMLKSLVSIRLQHG